ncbi:Imm7 family immunity protein [Streptomyces microflavus]|uniref:Imm7 family immunity protein n=1 Tax=Streptomyces microflavus TaxID=1919 RepID=UPI003BB5492B
MSRSSTSAASRITADEDPGHENEVRVLRLVRGRVTQHTETLLSPCIPTVEDPFTG